MSVIDEVIAQIPYARFLEVREDNDEDGSLVVLPFRDEIVGNVNLPAVHGGVVGAFLELTALLQEHGKWCGGMGGTTYAGVPPGVSRRQWC